MKRLTMKNADGIELAIEVDDATILGYGGFGSIYGIPTDPNRIVKRIELNPPQPTGNARTYVAHIQSTRDRLLAIKNEELRASHPRRFIVESIDEIVNQVLSTHWCFELSNLQLGAVWYLQWKAPGKSLLDRFKEPRPSEDIRRAIAMRLIARMRTLRRADLVHMDCVPDNIFVSELDDLKPFRVSVIDLDGSGIVRRSGRADEWDHRPLTIGKLKSLRLPPWYPQVGIHLGPKSGNYMFGERWVIVDSIIRILSWNRMSILSWLEPATRGAIAAAYWSIQKAIDCAQPGDPPWDHARWSNAVSTSLEELRKSFDPLPPVQLDSDSPSCLEQFASLAQRAVFDTRALSSKSGSPYDLYRDWLR